MGERALDSRNDPEGVLAELKEEFIKWNTKGTPDVLAEDLCAFLKTTGQDLPLEDVTQLIDEVDRTGSGVADFNDILALLSNAQREKADDPQAPLRQAFRSFDRSDTGVISALDLHRTMMELGEQVHLEECKELLRFADRNGDGDINFEEFSRFLAVGK
eukprot:Hpha_TRINITY_DN4925_c0_g1::TRINITY_DN4925_c0_g1_i1::g.51276::m.51276/K02183/CALM; calmodulin